MVDCKAAPVRPRVLVPDSSETLILEDEVRTRVEARQWRIIELAGPIGAGKSVALGHLAHIFDSDRRLHLADRPSGAASQLLVDLATDRLVICTSPTFVETPEGLERWRLVPWGQDERIEYLLAVHHDQCASVMRRIRADSQWRWLKGVVGLWCVVLDRMAADETLCDVKSALRQELDAQLPTEVRPLARECAFAVLNDPAAVVMSAKRLLESGQIDPPARALLRHEQVNLLLAVEYLIEQLQGDSVGGVLEKRLPELLVREAATFLRCDEGILNRLRNVVASCDWNCHAMAASLLHAAGVGWVPADGRPAPRLSQAYLAGAQWPGVRLHKLNVFKTDLTGADLSGSKLEDVLANAAQMSGIRLHGAQLTRFVADRAQLADADLSFIRAPHADFTHADLRGANLEGALVAYGSFRQADLRGTACCRACLAHASFRDSQLDGADFSGADLSYANLRGTVLRVADFTGAKFAHAFMVDCDLEYMSLPGANFEEARLLRAHLTGSRIPAAKFRGADLYFTGLAEIDWPGADLRDADLRGATFHMGSSRSGLVGSPIASEGSRTGFYTDEYQEQEFKSPEEIRKANLCGADLRGARIDDVDFYLVDLRGAQYTADQEVHFRASGAILETRV